MAIFSIIGGEGYLHPAGHRSFLKGGSRSDFAAGDHHHHGDGDFFWDGTADGVRSAIILNGACVFLLRALRTFLMFTLNNLHSNDLSFAIRARW